MHHRLVITLVHGTFARGAQWTLKGSILCNHIAASLGSDTRFERFQWSGQNYQQARINAAAELKEFILARLLEQPQARHYIIAHSHGGNVALLALRDKELANRISGLITLATPFLRIKVCEQCVDLLNDCVGAISLAFLVVLTVLAFLAGFSIAFEVDELMRPNSLGLWKSVLPLFLIAASLIWLFISNELMQSSKTAALAYFVGVVAASFYAYWTIDYVGARQHPPAAADTFALMLTGGLVFIAIRDSLLGWQASVAVRIKEAVLNVRQRISTHASVSVENVPTLSIRHGLDEAGIWLWIVRRLSWILHDYHKLVMLLVGIGLTIWLAVLPTLLPMMLKLLNPWLLAGACALIVSLWLLRTAKRMIVEVLSVGIIFISVLVLGQGGFFDGLVMIVPQLIAVALAWALAISIYLAAMTLVPQIIRAHSLGFGRERILESLLVSIEQQYYPDGTNVELVEFRIRWLQWKVRGIATRSAIWPVVVHSLAYQDSQTLSRVCDWIKAGDEVQSGRPSKCLE